AEECLNTNFYGVKSTTEALLPLLKLSTCGARIVNISSLRGELRRIPSDDVRNQLGDVETLNENKLDDMVKRFLQDCKEDGARGPVKCALLPDDGPSGCYFDQTQVAAF
ncbi:unnamed protein product, partial [Linum tenue]